MGYEEKLTSPQREYTARCSASQLEEFLKSSVYRDFVDEMDLRINMLRDVMEDSPMTEYSETKGALQALRKMASIFVDLYENAKTDAEHAAVNNESEEV